MHPLKLGGISLVTALVAIVAQAQSPYIVGENVQVSMAVPDVQYFETQVAADPSEASHIMVGAYAIKTNGDVDNVFYVSFDGGRTWKLTSQVAAGVDPAVAIGPKGLVITATIHDVPRKDGGTSDSFLLVNRSTDGGRSWKESEVRVDSRSVDRAYIGIDANRKRVFAHGYLADPRDTAGNKTVSPFVLYTSDDSGRTFGRVVSREGVISGTPKVVPANGVLLRDGTWVALAAFLDSTRLNMMKGRSDAASAPELNGTIGVLRSADGGRTLEPFKPITDVHYDWRVPQLSMAGLAIDQSGGPFDGRLYAVWPEARFDRRTQIFMAYSDDGGRKWTTPQVVSDEVPTATNPRPNNFMPAVAVNRDGVVGVLWYDRRDNADNLGYWPRFSASLNGGATFLPSVRVSTSPNLVLDQKELRLNGGDTVGLAADARGAFHAAWIDNRTGSHHVWTASVQVRGKDRK